MGVGVGRRVGRRSLGAPGGQPAEPYLTRYFEAVDKDRLLELVALLEVVPPDGQAHRAAVAFLESLRLDDE